MEYRCPIETTLSLISGKWKVLILKELIKEPVRYGALKKRIPRISSKVLTQQLREMEKDGLILREIFAEVPPRVEYTLTGMGWDLIPLIDHMREYGAKWLNDGSPSEEYESRE